MAQDLYDEYGDNAGAEGGPPVVSWKFSEPGEPTARFTGIIVPPDPINEPAKGHRPVADRNKDGARVWPPRVGYIPKPGVNPKAPISADEYLSLTGGDDSEMREVSLTELTLVTGYTNKEFMSAPKRAAAREDPEFVDNGMRRFLKDGKDVPAKFDAALKAIKATRPLPGQRFTIELIAREPNVGKEGETRRHTIRFEPPTPETMKVVEAYIAAAKSGEASQGVEDPYASTGSAPEEPPF